MQQPIRIASLWYRAAKHNAPSGIRVPTLVNAGHVQKRALSSSIIAASSPSINTSLYSNHRHPKTIIITANTKSQTLRTTSIPQLTQLRNASATSTSSPSSTTAILPQTLDWQTFFRLRQSRRRYSLIASIFGSLTTSWGAIFAINTTPLSDTLTTLSPIPDPFVSLGLFTFATAGVGWLIGPFFGTAVWRMLHSQQVPGFMVREKDFYERVKRYRVDPRGASAQNPVPDYYGEKVGSRDEWRTWLKDQRAFNRKREGKGAGAGGSGIPGF